MIVMDELVKNQGTLDIIIDVTREQINRDKPFIDILSKVLGVRPEYKNWIEGQGNTIVIDIASKVEECLNLWNERNYGDEATRKDLVDTLKKNQRFGSCQVLIVKLEGHDPLSSASVLDTSEEKQLLEQSNIGYSAPTSLTFTKPQSTALETPQPEPAPTTDISQQQKAFEKKSTCWNFITKRKKIFYPLLACTLIAIIIGIILVILVWHPWIVEAKKPKQESKQECNVNEDCPVEKPHCRSHICYACLYNDHCLSTLPFCHSDHQCVECISSDSCPSERPVCSNNICRKCENDQECDISHEYCNFYDGTCENFSGYDYRLNTWIDGHYLGRFGDLNGAITYCNSHSNCDGVNEIGCNGESYHPMDGTPSTSTTGSCSWVKT